MSGYATELRSSWVYFLFTLRAEVSGFPGLFVAKKQENGVLSFKLFLKSENTSLFLNLSGGRNEDN